MQGFESTRTSPDPQFGVIEVGCSESPKHIWGKSYLA